MQAHAGRYVSTTSHMTTCFCTSHTSLVSSHFSVSWISPYKVLKLEVIRMFWANCQRARQYGFDTIMHTLIHFTDAILASSCRSIHHYCTLVQPVDQRASAYLNIFMQDRTIQHHESHLSLEQWTSRRTNPCFKYHPVIIHAQPRVAVIFDSSSIIHIQQSSCIIHNTHH